MEAQGQWGMGEEIGTMSEARERDFVRLRALTRRLSDALLTVAPLGGSECFTRTNFCDEEAYYADPEFFTRRIKENHARLRNALERAARAEKATTPTPQQEAFDADTQKTFAAQSAFFDELKRREAAREEAFDAMREALEPFAEIARRVGWDKLDENDPARNGHILEAPADDIAPGAFFVLHVSDFVNAALAQADAANSGAGE